MQAFWLKAVLTFTGFPDVLSEGVASRHFPRPQRVTPCCSVHGRTFVRVLPFCSPGMATVLSSDHSETAKRMGTRIGKTGQIMYLLFLNTVNDDSE